MHQKTRNLIEMWKEKGYGVVGTNEQSAGKDLMQLKLFVYKSEGGSIELHKEWDTFKKLASRQEFYVIPICELPEIKHVELCVVRKDRISQRYKSFKAIGNELRYSYWFTQGDRSLRYLESVRADLEQTIKRIDRTLRTMHSTNNQHFIQSDFVDFQTYKDWEYYLSQIDCLKRELSKNDKLSNELKNEMAIIVEDYSFNQ